MTRNEKLAVKNEKSGRKRTTISCGMSKKEKRVFLR
jgi:hypothetical protein